MGATPAEGSNNYCIFVKWQQRNTSVKRSRLLLNGVTELLTKTAKVALTSAPQPRVQNVEMPTVLGLRDKRVLKKYVTGEKHGDAGVRKVLHNLAFKIIVVY